MCCALGKEATFPVYFFVLGTVQRSQAEDILKELQTICPDLLRMLELSKSS